MTTIKETTELRRLIAKLGHALSEIRQRSLENILSKLRNDIIKIEDLLHHRELFSCLLRNLNCDVDNVDKILELLVNLSKFPIGTKTLIELGGIEYFTLFRQDLQGKECFVDNVDKILNNLFLYHDQLNVEDVPITSHSKQTEALPKTGYDYATCQNVIGHYESHKRLNDSTTQSKTNATCEKTWQELSSHADTDIKTQNLSIGNCADLSVNHMTFPWISLTSGDRQILAVTDNRLQSSSFDLIIQSCSFLNDVLLHDFPAEVFIQRPNIVKTLFTVLALYKSKRIDVVEHVLSCFCVLCLKLQKRLLQHQNHDLWLPLQNPEDIMSLSVSTNPTESSSLSSKSTGHLQTTESPVTEVDSQRDADDFESSLITNALVQGQLTMDEFLLMALNATVDMLCLYSNENFMFSNVAMLHIGVLRLLRFGHVLEKWKSSQKDDKKMIYSLMTILHKFDDVVDLFLEDAKLTQNRQQKTLKSIIVCQVLVKLLDATVPNERMYEVLTEKIVKFFQIVITKVSFLSELEDLKRSLERILSSADETFYRTYVKALDVVKSIRGLDCFFQGIKTDNELLHTCQIIHHHLEFHCHKVFIKDVVNLCCKKYYKNVDAKNKWMEFLLQLLKHKNENVKESVYMECLDKLTMCFSTSLVTAPLSIKFQPSLLFFQKKILVEIVEEGVFHQNTKVMNTAKNIIVTIITSRLNMSPKYWKTFMMNLPPFLPILQCCLGHKDNAFDRAVFSFINYPQSIMSVDGTVNGLTELEQMRACLRLMFLKLPKMRSTGFALSLVYVTNRDKERRKIINYSHVRSQIYEDLFVFESKFLAGLNHQPQFFDDIAVENVAKLWEVFNDRVIDSNLRYSAAEQLSILFQDGRLQKSAALQESYKCIMDEINKLIYKDDGSWSVCTNSSHVDEKYLQSLLKMLKHLVQCQFSIRHVLALQQNVLLDFFQLALLFVKNTDICYEISVILVYLLFDDVIISNNMLKEEFFVPRCILKNYRFPVQFQALQAYENWSDEDSQDVTKTVHEKPIVQFIKESCLLQCDWMKSDNMMETCKSHFQISKEETDGLQHLHFSNIIETIKHNLMHADNHFSAIASLDQFKLVLLIIADGDNNKHADIHTTLADYCQNGFIKRVFDTAPHTKDDHKLFKNAISFLECAFKMNVNKRLNELQLVILSESTLRLIHNPSQSPEETSHIKWIRSSKQSVVTCLTTMFEHTNASHVTWKSTKVSHQPHLGDVILAIYQDLSATGSEAYYDLPLMEIMLGCLVHFLTQRQWSMNLIGGENLCIQMFSWLTQILMSFHVDRVSSAVSYMGKGIVQKSVTCLCHLLHEIKMFGGKNFFQTSSHEINYSNSSERTSIIISSQLPWLIPLLSDRSIDIRWGGWALSTALLADTETGELVVNEFQSLPGGLWATSLGVILDGKECFLVRTQACMLLSHLIMNYDEEKQGGLWNSMVVQDTNSKTEINGLDAFMLLLDHFSFFAELKKLLDNDFKGSNTSHALLINASTSFSQGSSGNDSVAEVTSVVESSGIKSTVSKNSNVSGVVSGNTEQDISSLSSSSTRKDCNPSTDGTSRCGSLRFKASIIKLIVHLILLSPHTVMKKLVEEQLVNKLFNTWSAESLIESTEWLISYPGEKIMYHSFHDNIEITVCLLNLVCVVTRCYENSLVILSESRLTNKMFSLFVLCKYDHKAIRADLIRVWDELMTVITNVDDFQEQAMNHLQYICVSFISVLNASKHKRKIIDKFLMLILSTVRNMNNFDSCVVGDNFQSITTGGDNILVYPQHGDNMADILSDILLYVYHKSYVFKNVCVVRNTLSCLFACSRRSQTRAYENGFIESIIEELKHHMVNMNMLSLDDDKNVRKKRNEILDEISDLMNLIRNFCVYNSTVKCGYIRGGLLLHLQNVWTCCGLYEGLKHSLLQMLIVLSANCETAQSSLCLMSSERQTLEECSFLHYVAKMLVQLHQKSVSVHGKMDCCLHWCFEIVSNTLNVAECRTLLYKANTFHLFLTAHTLTSTGNKLQRRICKSLIADWLKLFVALSYHQDGASAIGKIPGCLQVFLEILKDGNKQRKDFILLIIRNLLFVARLKQMIASNQLVTNAVMEFLNSPSLKTKLISLSIFWAMLYENQKAKVLIKKTNLSTKLFKLKEDMDAGRCLSVDGDLELHDKLKVSLKMTLNLLAE